MRDQLREPSGQGSGALCLLYLWMEKWLSYPMVFWPSLKLQTVCDAVPAYLFSELFVAFCSASLGHPLSLSSCLEAFSAIPQGILPSTFTTRQSVATNNWIQVPKHYSHSNNHPSCNITIDLEGNSQHDVFVRLPFNALRKIARSIIRACVIGSADGGYTNYGLRDAAFALLEPTAYDGSAIKESNATAVQQPDGSVDSVAIHLPLKVDVVSFLTISLLPSKTKSSRKELQYSCREITPIRHPSYYNIIARD